MALLVVADPLTRMARLLIKDLPGKDRRQRGQQDQVDQEGTTTTTFHRQATRPTSHLPEVHHHHHMACCLRQA